MILIYVWIINDRAFTEMHMGTLKPFSPGAHCRKYGSSTHILENLRVTS
jgi:hypothetical protein